MVGQEQLLDRMLIALITGGHILVEGVPGLAKTTAIKNHGPGSRPEISAHFVHAGPSPADVIGTFDLQSPGRHVRSEAWPVFTNLLLADEINRAPAKVQSALLEAMQEHQVTIGDRSYPLPEPFLVMATQNPNRTGGHLSLPEAQIDRFHAEVPYRLSVEGRTSGAS